MKIIMSTRKTKRTKWIPTNTSKFTHKKYRWNKAKCEIIIMIKKTNLGSQNILPTLMWLMIKKKNSYLHKKDIHEW